MQFRSHKIPDIILYLYLKNGSTIRRFHRLTQIFSRLQMCIFSPEMGRQFNFTFCLIGENLRNLRTNAFSRFIAP